MGGCSSKPQTAECCEVSPLQTALKASHSSAHQTLESLFNQHGRDGEDLLEDAQTLHELLLHAVDSKELPPCHSQSSGDMASTTEHAENCTRAKQAGSMSNLPENDQAKGAANLEEPLPGILAATVTTDANCGKAEMTPLDPPEKAVENHIEGYGTLSNATEKNQEKAGIAKASVPDFAEMKPEAEEGELCESAEENAIELASGSLDLKAKPDLQKKSTPALPGCAEHETWDLNLGPKSDYSKSSEPTLLQSLPTNDMQKMEAPQSMENQGVDPPALEDSDMKAEIRMETSKMPKPDEKCEKDEKVLQGEGVGEQSGQAMEGEKLESVEEDKKTETQDAKEVLVIDADRHDGEKAELQHEKAMEAELPKIQSESGWELLEQGKEATEESTSTEKAMGCEKENMQDELHRDKDRKAMHTEKVAATRGEEVTAGAGQKAEKLNNTEDARATVQEVAVGVAQHCEAEKLDDRKDARTIVPEKSLIDELATTEKGDDKSESDPLNAKEEKKAVEPLEEHHVQKAAEKSCMECVESKPNHKRNIEEDTEDFNEAAHMEASKESKEKGEEIRVME